MALYDASKLNMKKLQCNVKLINGKQFIGKDISTSANDLLFSFWDSTKSVLMVIPYSQIESIEMFEGEE